MLEKAAQIWAEKKRLPTDAEYMDVLTQHDISAERLQWLKKHAHYQKMVHERGLFHAENTSELTPEQIAAINVYFDLSDRRVMSRKLKDLGILLVQWENWKKSPIFQKSLQARGEELFASGLPAAHRALLDKVEKGDIRAVKLFYDKIGYGADVAGNNANDIQVILLRLVEVVQKHVKDPVVLRAIAADFDLVSHGEQVTMRGEIERA